MAKRTNRSFVLQKVQPALLGLMDGAVSTLAPIFAAAGLTGKPQNAFFVGLAASLGAGVSMGLAEALSDDGSVTGRGGPLARGAITGVATAIGGMLHTFPFLISNLDVALKTAYAVVAAELVAIAFIRYRFMSGNLWATIRAGDRRRRNRLRHRNLARPHRRRVTARPTPNPRAASPSRA
jgi:erythrin-vacuolar iron transport family protein